MNGTELKELLDGLGIPFAFHHWERPPAMPYGVYFDDYTDNFPADDHVYLVVRHFNIELYTRRRDAELEGRLEALLNEAGLYWDKDAAYINTERFYQISYEIEV